MNGPEFGRGARFYAGFRGIKALVSRSGKRVFKGVAPKGAWSMIQHKFTSANASIRSALI